MARESCRRRILQRSGLTLKMLSMREYRGEREMASERFTSREACRYRRRTKKNITMNGANAGMIHGTTRHTSTRDPAHRSCTFQGPHILHFSPSHRLRNAAAWIYSPRDNLNCDMAILASEVLCIH